MPNVNKLVPAMRSFRPMFVFPDGSRAGNAQRFATRKEAEDSARARFRVWMMPKGWEVDESDDPVNYAIVEGRDTPINRVKEEPEVYAVPHPTDHFLVAGANYWGRGPTVEEAVKAAQWMRPGDRVRVYKVDKAAHVTDMGFLVAYSRELLGTGTVKKGTVVNIVGEPRSIKVIAADVRAHWPKVNYAALPYLAAMETLDKITDDYYADSAVSVVSYFLANANSFRGDDARRIKAELKSMLENV